MITKDKFLYYLLLTIILGIFIFVPEIYSTTAVPGTVKPPLLSDPELTTNNPSGANTPDSKISSTAKFLENAVKSSLPSILDSSKENIGDKSGLDLGNIYDNVLRAKSSTAPLHAVLEFLPKIIKDIPSIATEGYFVYAYLDAVVIWIKMHLDVSYSPTEVFEIFNIYEFLVPAYGGSVEQDPKSRFPELNSSKSTTSPAFLNASQKGSEWLSTLLGDAIKTPQLSNFIKDLAPEGKKISSKFFPVPESEKIINHQEALFLDSMMEIINKWLQMGNDNKEDPFPNPIKSIASAVVKEIESKTPSVLSASTKWAAKHPLGPSESPLASPLFILGAFFCQVIVQTLLVAIPKENFIDIINKFQQWMEEPITSPINIGMKEMNLGKLAVSFINDALESNAETKGLPLPERGLNWGLLIGILSVMIHRMKGNTSYTSSLSKTEMGSLTNHLKSLIKAKETGPRAYANAFWNFFDGLPKDLTARVTHWLGSIQATSRLAIYALGQYKGAELTAIDRQVQLSIPFEILDVILEFPLIGTECTSPSSIMKEAVDVALVGWMIYFIGMITHLESMIGSRNVLDHDLAPRDRSSISWSILVRIPCLFCQFYLWALASIPKKDPEVNQELLNSAVSGLPFSGVKIKNYANNPVITRMWKTFFVPEDELIVDKLNTLGGSIGKDIATPDTKDWILQQLIMLLKAKETSRNWNGPIGGCPKDPPPKPEPEPEPPASPPSPSPSDLEKKKEEELNEISKGAAPSSSSSIIVTPPPPPIDTNESSGPTKEEQIISEDSSCGGSSNTEKPTLEDLWQGK